MLSAVDRYLARLIAVPLFSTLVIAAMLLVLDKMLRLFDFVAQEGGPVSVVFRMLANLLPEYLSLGIPIGLMLGILLAFRRLATSSELDVLRAVGLGYGRLLLVPYLFTIALAILNLAIVGFIQPKARYAYEGLQFELRSGALGASIKVGEFTTLGQQMTVRIEQSHNRGADLSGIFVRAESKGDRTLAVTAEKGSFLRTDDPDVIIFRLKNGTLVHNEPGFVTPRVLSFTSHDLPIDLPKVERFRSRGGKERELTIPELVRIGSNSHTTPAQRNESRANFHFRIVEVVSMFLLPLLAVALAVPPKRSTSALGVFLSIVIVVTYHKVNEYAQGMGSLGRIDPLIALWVPFLLFAALVGWLYYQLAYVPGGQPIGGLERVFSKAFTAVRRWFRLDRRKRERLA
ncbi:LPS export ABC transporter permease LptF [Sphingomonas tabacisoli]|uniref:LPS export ABC transporter permease LptF n=1 Tax=Sphingomonas tabacisoli TaxID=2249466 RepID=A0ABW4HZA1_9SPHN